VGEDNNKKQGDQYVRKGGILINMGGKYMAVWVCIEWAKKGKMAKYLSFS
jgi:hypothetical protein